jgi:predicted amidohydrolase YtcJ
VIPGSHPTSKGGSNGRYQRLYRGGKVADLCVIGDDIFTVDPHKIGEIPVLMTIVGGKVVYDEN